MAVSAVLVSMFVNYVNYIRQPILFSTCVYVCIHPSLSLSLKNCFNSFAWVLTSIMDLRDIWAKECKPDWFEMFKVLYPRRLYRCFGTWWMIPCIWSKTKCLSCKPLSIWWVLYEFYLILRECILFWIICCFLNSSVDIKI